MVKLDIFFAEFNSVNQPDLANIGKYFPEANIRVVTEQDYTGPFSPHEVRYGNLMNDYWKCRLLLDSEADVAIAFDADIKIVSEDVRRLIPLTQRFGLCLPANPRKLVRIDTLMGAGSDKRLDDTGGMGYAVNMTPIAFNTHNLVMRNVLEEYCRIIQEDRVRGPLAMWRAFYETGKSPCLLPPNWCVCVEDVGIGNEIILHTGHEGVAVFYGK